MIVIVNRIRMLWRICINVWRYTMRVFVISVKHPIQECKRISMKIFTTQNSKGFAAQRK